MRRVRPGVRPRYRAPAGRGRPAGDRLPPVREGRYTTPRARPGVRRPGRAVFQSEHAGSAGAGGGAVAATRMISILGRNTDGKPTPLVALAVDVVARKVRARTI